MTTPNNYNFNPIVSELVTSALRLIGAVATGETPHDNEISEGIEALNYMVKDWQNEGIGLWLNKEVILFPELNEYAYSLGPTGDHASESFANTTLSALVASGASSITITSSTGFSDTYDVDGIITAVTPVGAGAITFDGVLVTDSIAYLPSTRKIVIASDGNDSGVTFGITGTDALGASQTETITGPNTTSVYSANEYKTVTSVSISGAGAGNITVGTVGDFVGIELDDGTLQWTNIVSAVSTTLTLLDVTTDAAASGNFVYSYTSKIQRPYSIIEIRRTDSCGNETSVDLVSRSEYMALNLKTGTGPLNQAWYDPQLTNGTLHIWQASNDVQDVIKFTSKTPLTDFDNLSDVSGFPQNALKALKYNLAVDLASEYGQNPLQAVQMEALRTKNNLVSFDVEDTSVFFGIDFSGRAVL